MAVVTVEEVCDMVRAKLGGTRARIELGEHTVLRDVGLSSLQIADVVYTIEDKLDIEFDPAKAADIITIDDLVELARVTALADTH